MLATPHSLEEQLCKQAQTPLDKAIYNHLERAVQNGLFKISRLVATRSNGITLMMVLVVLAA